MSSTFKNDMLANRNPAAPITAFDGLVAAHMHYNGQHILCTSPNQRFVPLPVLGEEDVRLRSNLRYGVADHTLWPQFTLPGTSHFATMPRKPEPDHRLSPIWWDPTPNDFVPSYGGIITGIGSVPQPWISAFQRVERELQARIDAYLDATPKPSANAIEQINLRRYHMQNALIRIISLKVSYVETAFTVTEFQRYSLEILGFLNYMQIYRPRLSSNEQASNKADDLMGSFTWDSQAAQDLFKAGVPVWFLRRWEGSVYPYTNNILEVVDFVHPDPSILKECTIITLPTQFRGLMTDPQRYSAIWHSSMARLTSADPFRGESTPHASSEPSTSSLSSAISSRPYPEAANRATKPYSRSSFMGQPSVPLRDKFTPLSHPAAPFPIDAWREGLASVDRAPANIIDREVVGKTAGHYVVPDPGVIVGPQSEARRLQYIISWLHIRSPWFNITLNGGLAQSNQSWRDILGCNFNWSDEDSSNPSRYETSATMSAVPKHPSLPARPSRTSKKRSSQNTTPRERRMQVLNLFKTKSIFERATQVSPVLPPPVWNETTISESTLPPDSTIREILWELYEINFVYELEGLDLRLCDFSKLGPNATFERHGLVVRCYDTYHQYKRPDIPMRNVGLAADDIKERLPFVIALARVMLDWKGNVPSSFSTFCKSLRPELLGMDRAIDFERDVAKFYCQMLFNYFGRAAQVPHRLYQLQ